MIREEVMIATIRWNKMLNNDYYTYRVTWSAEDKEYVGLCSEFPSLSWLANNHDQALQGIRELVAEVVADMQHNNEIAPEPFVTKRFSGKFQVRIPPDLHRQLTLEAVESGISLNRLASDKLRKAHGWSPPRSYLTFTEISSPRHVHMQYSIR